MSTDPHANETAALLEFMVRLAQSYLACGEQTAQVELFLRRIASAHGMRGSRIVAFPTAIFISVHDGVQERVTLAEGPTKTLRLDQIADVYELGAKAQRGSVPPRDGLQQLNTILQKSARFGTGIIVVGHTVLTLGLAIVLMPTLMNLAAAVVLGATVGGLKVLNRDRPVLAVPLPVVAAALVSALVFLAIKQGVALDPRYALVPPLVAFLPGGMLTLGMEELAYGDMVSGSSRLITGFVQLVLLAFGLAAGAAIVGYTSENLVSSTTDWIMPRWATWVGVLVFGIGVFLHFSAPRNSLLWTLLVLLLAFAAQQFAATVFGPEISGFFGMLVATLLGHVIETRFKGPSAMVTILPSFWLLVPGAMGLLSAKRMLSDRVGGIDSMAEAVFEFTAIALGALMGASLFKWVTEKFGWLRRP